ncbi:MAG: MATE family efflux transporter [Candidatus Limimorpha sp.]
MKTSVSNKEIWHIAYPIILGNLAQTIITFTDTAFLGHIGTIELSASMMAGLYYYVFTNLAAGLASGIQIFIARRYGEGEYGKIGQMFQHGAVFVFLIGLLLFGALFSFSNMAFRAIISSREIYLAAVEYLKYRQFGILFVVFNFLFRGFYVGICKTKVITYSTIIMAVVNIVFDWLLVFGHCGFPEMGIEGAAIASLLAEITAFGFFWVYTYIVVPHKKYGMFCQHGIQLRLMLDILKVSFPSMIQRLLSYGTWFVFFVMIEKMGEEAIGVSSVMRSIYMILVIPAFAFASTACTLTSRIIGEGKSDEVMATVWKVVRNSLLCSVLPLLLTFAIPQQVLQIYTSNIGFIKAALPTVYVVCFATLLTAVSAVLFDAVSGTGNTTAAMLFEGGVVVFYLAHIYMMTRLTSIEWVWTAEWVYNFLIGCVSYVYLRHANWRRKVI